MSFWKKFFHARTSSQADLFVVGPTAVFGLGATFALGFGGPVWPALALMALSAVYGLAARAIAVWPELPPLETFEARRVSKDFRRLSPLPRTRRRAFAQALVLADRELAQARASLDDVEEALGDVRAVSWSAPQLADELYLAQEELETRVRAARDDVFAVQRSMVAAADSLAADRAADAAVRAARALTRARMNVQG